MEEHQEKFSTFFRDFTGRTLKRCALTGAAAAGAVKREAGPVSGKSQPKVKVRKMEQPLIEGMGGASAGRSKQLSTDLLASGQSLDSGTHMNRGKPLASGQSLDSRTKQREQGGK